jgi:uncharacterized membrane protein YfcA
LNRKINDAFDRIAAIKPAVTTPILLAAVFLTATLSGIFGMAGGIILMGVFTALMPVSAAMVTHGGTQLVSNSWRAYLHRKHIQWRIIGIYFFGSITAMALLFAVHYAPSKAWVYLLLGLVPLPTWAPKTWFRLDAERPAQALAAGFFVTGMNMLAGGAGPLLDVFFVRTGLTRHQIVATKSATQTFSHIAKIVFYGAPLIAAKGQTGLPPLWFFIAMVPLAMAGGYAGSLVLNRLGDDHFKRLQRWLLTAIGLTYLYTAFQLFTGATPPVHG